MNSNNAPGPSESSDPGKTPDRIWVAPEDQSSGFITRAGLVAVGGIIGGFVAGAAMWTEGPALAVSAGFFAALGSAAALHGLLPKHW